MPGRDRAVTIHSDGTGNGTVIVTADGTQINDVVGASISISPREFNEVTLDLLGTIVKVDGTVKNVNFTCPICDHSEDHECDSVVGGGSPVTHPVQSFGASVPALEPGAGTVFEFNGRNVIFRVKEVQQNGGEIHIFMQDQESFDKAKRFSS